MCTRMTKARYSIQYSTLYNTVQYNKVYTVLHSAQYIIYGSVVHYEQNKWNRKNDEWGYNLIRNFENIIFLLILFLKSIVYLFLL